MITYVSLVSSVLRQNLLDLHHFLQPRLECERTMLHLSRDKARINWQDEYTCGVFVMNHYQFSFILKLELTTMITSISHLDLLRKRFRGTRKWSITGDGIGNEINMPESIFRASARGVYISSLLILEFNL